MKGERILYIILILVAIVVGIYGYTSGLLTPHHYHLVKKLPNSGFDDKDIFCEDATRVFYINNRENYLIDSESLESIGIDLIYYRRNANWGADDSHERTFKEITYQANSWYGPETGDFHDDIYNDLKGSRPEYIKHDILSNTFTSDTTRKEQRKPFSRYELGGGSKKYISCNLTKQFLQRN